MAKIELGLEVGSSAVRLAAVTKTRSGPALRHIAQAPLAAGVVVDGDVVDVESLTTAVRNLAKGLKGGTKEVHLGVVSQRMVARQVDLPWVPAREFKRALPLLAADCLPMPVEDCVLDFLAYEEVLDEDGTRAIRGLLVAAGEEGVQAMVDAVEAAGLRVVSVTLTPLSTLGAVADAHSPDPEALIDVGHVMTTVTIHEKAQPQFVRILSRGGRDITAELSDQLGISEQDAETWKCALPTTWTTMNPTDQAATEAALRAALADLVTDIRTSIDFYKTSEGKKIGRAYLVGGSAVTLGLVPILASVLRVPVSAGTAHALRPGKGLTPEEYAFAAGPVSAAAVGLALGAA